MGRGNPYPTSWRVMAIRPGALDPLDWGIIVAYAVIVVGVGLWVRARGAAGRGSDEFIVAHRQMPTWVATGSLLATELSAATFLGVPHAAFVGDWSYLQLLVGALIGRIVVATTMLRSYAALNLVTVYGLLGHRLGPRSHRLSAWLFIAGRLLASGVRLFIAALAFSVVTGLSLSLSIICAGSLAGLYASIGGIRSVMWTDIVQALVFIVAALAALWVGLETMGLDFGHILSLGATAGKLDFIGAPVFALDSAGALVPALIGGVFLSLAAQGTDQDLVQRLLTTRDPRGGSIAVIAAGVLSIPIVMVFLALGTTLWAIYTPAPGVSPPTLALVDAKRVLPEFALHMMPSGLRGLVFSGLFAAAMSSLDSAINALASTWVTDIRPQTARSPQRLSWVSATWTVLLTGCALAFAWYQTYLVEGAGLNLVELALSAMSVIYGGLLGGFAMALFVPSRGSDRSTAWAMALGSGAGLALFLQPLWLGRVAIAWTWWIALTAGLTVLVASVVPRPEPRRQL